MKTIIEITDSCAYKGHSVRIFQTETGNSANAPRAAEQLPDTGCEVVLSHDNYTHRVVYEKRAQDNKTFLRICGSKANVLVEFPAQQEADEPMPPSPPSFCETGSYPNQSGQFERL